MPISPSLPALAILITLKGLPGFGLPKPAAKVPVDSLPPAWRSTSRLALENEFVTSDLPRLVESMGFRLTFDPRSMRVDLDADSGAVSSVAVVGSIPVGPPVRQRLGEFSGDLTRRNFRRLWRKRSIDNINNRPGTTSSGSSVAGLSFKLPSPLPKRVQSLLGPGGPAINVAGSENIRLSGQSNWTNQQVAPLGQKRSLFPSLDMQQDLDIRLEGQLSDRIKVNLLQNSANQVPLANRIFINYRGDEDDLVQSLDLGNTSLSLPGTQFVSYSGKNEGLFGAKAALRLGPADFTVLASKQEGRSERASYTGGASKQSSTLADFDYVRGVYFLLFDPNVAPAWVPPSVLADPSFAGIEIPDVSIDVFLDDANYNNDVSTRRGKALLEPERRGTGVRDTSAVRGSFAQLNPGADQDFEILQDVYGPFFKVLRMTRPVTGDQRLAVSYRARAVRRDGSPLTDFFDIGGTLEADSIDGTVSADTAQALRLKLLRPPASALKPDATGGFDPNNVFTEVRELELRNFYQLPGQRIDPLTFSLNIRRGVDQPPVTVVRRPDNTTIPYIELLGLDNKDETRGQPVDGHDGVVDGTRVNSETRAFVDFENGTLFFLDPRPFAPRITGAAARPFDRAVSALLVRRDSLVTPGDTSATSTNPAIYDRYNARRDLDSRYYIDVDFSAARAVGEISLGRGNILDGSEVVTINGQPLTRDRDYTIDYDIGRLKLTRQLGAADQLNINYSYAPLFAQAGRTLIGSDFRLEGREKRFGAALLYESRGAQDLRPRIGEEPSRSVIADLNTEWTLHPDWLTRGIDLLPGVRTTTPSDFHVQAEMGASFPNPNTKDVVYIDDMEGVRDAVSLSMTAERWRNSSVPSLRPAGVPTLLTSLPKHKNAEVHWYSPPSAVKERELNPDLSDAQGGNNSRQVLAISVPRRPTRGIDNSASSPDTLWAGLTYPLDAVGLDLSRAQFLEVWVNDFNDWHNPLAPGPRMRGLNAKLHIDLGVVSEDEMRSPGVPPNKSLDSEDQLPRDNQLSVTSGNNEDTGKDARLDDREPGIGSSNPLDWRDLVTASAADPEGDDFGTVDEAFKEQIDTRRFRRTNGTEGNKNLLPYPDTEDLNLNNNLDTSEDFLQFTIPLGDRNSPYLVTDVLRDYPGRPQADSLNGWRRYRVPLNDSLRKVFGSPDLTLTRHVRVWIEGLMRPDPSPDSVGSGPVRPLLMLGGLDIVGSRWQAAVVDTEITTLTLNSVNSVEQPFYVPPFDPGETLSGNQSLTRREQSLAVEFTELLPGGSVEAFKTFSLDENYSRYGSLTWYATGYDVPGYDAARDTMLYYFLRFASDETGRNYYEYRSRLPRFNGSRSGWQTVDLALTQLSNLKLRGDFPLNDPIHYVVAGPNPGDSLVVHGRPSFTRLRRVSLGLLNLSNQTVPRGQLWFNELRATRVAKDAGRAGRLQVDGKLANLMRYNLSWNQRDADFVTVGETRGTGNTNSQLQLGGGLDLHRFFEGTGIVLPINASFGRSVSRPRFTAGDDVVRTGALQDASESRSESRGFNTSYSRMWGDRSNPFLRYTIGGLTANYSFSENDGRTPTSLTAGVSRSANVSWSISPRALMKIGVPGTRFKLYPLPERVYWGYAVSTSNTRNLDRQRDGTVLPRNNITSRGAALAYGADTRPFDLLHHHFDATRNLMLPPGLLERFGFINLGRVVQWKQNFDSRYVLNRGAFLSPSLSWNSNYNQDNRPELSPDLSVRAISNGQSMSINWLLPFDRLRPPPAVRDTSGRKPRWSPRSLLYRIGGVSTDATFSQSSAYSRLAGTPDLLYLAGLTSSPGFRSGGDGVTARFGNSSNRGNDFRTGARTRILLGWDASLSMRGEYTARKNDANEVVTRSVSSRFPDFEVDYGKVANAVRLTKLMVSPTLRTAYSQSVQTDYRGSGGQATGRLVSSQWSPLLSMSGMLKNQTRTELRIERRVSRRENFQLRKSVTFDRNTDVNLNLSRSYSRGQKVNVLGRESNVRSNVNLSMAMVYSKQSGETRQEGISRPQLPVNRDRLSVTGNGAYSFSNNVTGNLTLGFGQNRDIERASVSRNVRVEVRASFSF